MLHDQFILSRHEQSMPDDFASYRSNGWSLSANRQLPVIPLANRPGWLLGWPVENRRMIDSWRFPERNATTALYGLSGRWICLVLDEEPSCYLDAAGTLAVVYSPEREVLASTTTMLNYASLDTFISTRLQQHQIATNQFLPAGLTSDPHALRLLPNHLLDLSTWTAKRHWPSGSFERCSEPSEQITRIGTAMRDTLIAIADRYHLALPLTAGRDSRMLMAAARPVANESTFVTFVYADDRRTDAQYARIVSRRFGLQNVEVPLETVDEDARRNYLVRVGFDANEGKARDFDQGARRHVPLTHAWITGFAGEVGTGPYWKDADADTSVSPDLLLNRMRLTPTSRSRDAVRNWLANVPHQDVFELFDLAYLELRVGCWAAPQMYGTAPFVANILPMAQREVISAMLRLPVDYRRQKRMAVDLVRENWPELADLPFGRAPGVAGFSTRLRRSMRRQVNRLVPR